MAEFQQIMKDWRRMCLSYKSCGDCPMMDADGHAHILCSEGGIQCAVPEIQEAVIKKWAVEHPEPVYPTWMEWLTDVGAIPKAISWDEPLVEAVYDAIQNPIPADIAQKLGIEPKEVQHG